MYLYHITERANLAGIRAHGLRSLLTISYFGDEPFVSHRVYFLTEDGFRDVEANMDRLNRTWKDPVVVRFTVPRDQKLGRERGAQSSDWVFVELPAKGYFKRPMAAVEIH